MSVFVRVAFYTLAAVLTQLAQPGVASPSPVAAGVAVEQARVHQAPHPANCGVRASLPDHASDRLPDDATCTTRPPAAIASVAAGLPAGLLRLGAVTNVSVLLPPARAPPALS